MNFMMFPAVLLAYFVKGLTGFANTLVFSTVMSFTENNINITPIDLVLVFPNNAILVWRERKKVDWSICLPLCAIVLAGSLPGTFLLKSVDAHLLKILFGFVVAGLGVNMLMNDAGHGMKTKNRIVLILIAVVSGLMCGLFGIGALLAAYMNKRTDDPGTFKANLCMVFIFESLVRLILYCLTGIFTLEVLKKGLILLPVSLVGLYIGMKISSKANDKAVRKIINIMLILSGLSLVLTNL